MATINRFEDLDVWKVSRELCKKIGSLIDNNNFERNYRLIGQIEGSSGSIMDNIAEQFDVFRTMAVRLSALIQKFIEYLQQTNIKGI